MRKNSIKNIRINEEVRKELQDIIMRRLKDPRVHPMTSVTKVEVAPDLKTCRAYISVLGPDESLDSTISGLRAAEGYVRHELARTVNLRNTPEIRFIPDASIAYGVDMSYKIDEVIAEDTRRREESDALYGEEASSDTDDTPEGSSEP